MDYKLPFPLSENVTHTVKSKVKDSQLEILLSVKDFVRFRNSLFNVNLFVWINHTETLGQTIVLSKLYQLKVATLNALCVSKHLNTR